ncbi:Hypothetical protein Ccan_14190 [Capnocytophaga canimorsus Cc5]|uniref:Uncharacterized protein n=1 Tax=Capnocytophaga canimorsus (strain 5) TaxID=860228 RepID=F9YQJ6_CAPCC|nr:Hypothetical protein Ccan_14190 [Capnocytophaga canimorsus Cc5]
MPQTKQRFFKRRDVFGISSLFMISTETVFILTKSFHKKCPQNICFGGKEVFLL